LDVSHYDKDSRCETRLQMRAWHNMKDAEFGISQTVGSSYVTLCIRLTPEEQHSLHRALTAQLNAVLPYTLVYVARQSAHHRRAH